MDRNYDCLVKVLLCGDSGVGKTCLISQFTDGQVRKSHITTIGKFTTYRVTNTSTDHMYFPCLQSYANHMLLHFLFLSFILPYMCSPSFSSPSPSYTHYYYSQNSHILVSSTPTLYLQQSLYCTNVEQKVLLMYNIHGNCVCP